MGYFQKNEFLSPDNFIHIYSGTSKDELNKQIDEVLLSDGYRMIIGNPGNAVYEKGNKTMRVWFGAFVKYYKFKFLTFSDDSGNIKVQVVKDSSGMSGGMIGMDQVKKELTRLSIVLQSI